MPGNLRSSHNQFVMFLRSIYIYFQKWKLFYEVWGPQIEYKNSPCELFGDVQHAANKFCPRQRATLHFTYVCSMWRVILAPTRVLTKKRLARCQIITAVCQSFGVFCQLLAPWKNVNLLLRQKNGNPRPSPTIHPHFPSDPSSAPSDSPLPVCFYRGPLLVPFALGEL